MTNNDILKKLRVALQLRDDQIVEILELVDFRISKGEIGNFFRNEDHPKFVECKDQILRNFLNGLVLFLRGTKENPKNPKEVLDGIKAAIPTDSKIKDKPKAFKSTQGKPGTKSKSGATDSKKMDSNKPKKSFPKNNPAKINPVEKVKFTIKKTK